MADETLKFLLETMMKLNDGSECHFSLNANGITSARDIGSLEEGAIDTLETKVIDPNNPKKKINEKIPMYMRQLLRIAADFIRMKSFQSSGYLSDNDILNFDISEWETFRLYPVEYRKMISTPQLPNRPPNAYSPQVPKNAELENFRKNGKRNKSEYDELKDERNFEVWRIEFLATAASHRISEVFDGNYVPIKQEEIDLFTEQQYFAFSVLAKVLKTDFGKGLVRQYESTRDAQSIWREFLIDMKTSTKAQLSATELCEWLTSIKFDSNWKSNATHFVLYFLNKMRDHDTYAENPLDKFSDRNKLVLLQNTVSGVPELRQVRAQADMNNTQFGKRLSYKEYSDLLLSAAAAYDKVRPTTRNRNQNVYFSSYNDDPNDGSDGIYLDDQDEEINIDTHLVNVTRRPPIQPRRQRVHQQEYARPFIRGDVWSQLPSEAKELLLQYGPKKPSIGNNEGRDKGKVHFTDTHNPSSTSGNDGMSVHTVDLYSHNGTDVSNFASTAGTSINSTSTRDSPGTMINSTVRNSSSPDPNESDFLRQILSTSHTTNPGISKSVPVSETNNGSTITLNGKMYRQVLTITYRVSNMKSHHGYSLIDRGANGGVVGNDARIIEKSDRRITLTGLGNHQECDLPLCTAAAYTNTHAGPVIIIMHQYAYIHDSKTIHSSIQLEAFKIAVDEKSRKVAGGKQRLSTPDGYLFPLNIIQGLAYLKIRPPTDHEFENLPHVILTSDVDWDPSIYDNLIDEDTDGWFSTDDVPRSYPNHPFDNVGDFTKHHVAVLDCLCTDQNMSSSVFDLKRTPTTPDYVALQPYFGWSPLDIVQHTLANTTQYARHIPMYTDMRKHYRSRFPALNVGRRHEIVATDSIFSDTPAIDDGAKCAQFFVGRESLVCDIFGMKTEKEFTRTLEDVIRRRGAMDKLVSDRAKVEISNKARDLLRSLFIDDWQSEPHHQHQNYAERRYGTVKSKTNIILNRTGAPASCWLLCLSYVCFLMNRLATESLNWMTPMQVLTGETPDISIIMQFIFYEQVYYSRVDTSFPSESTEEVGFFVGFGEHVGDAMTFKVLTQDTNKIIYRSNVRSANNEATRNKRADIPAKEPNVIYIKSKSEQGLLPASGIKPLPGFNPSELLGRTYLDLPGEDGQKFRMRIIKAISDHQESIDKAPERIKFLVQCRDKDKEQILTYNEILDHINRNINDDDDIDNQTLKFKSIITHQGPLTSKDPGYNGSKYNVLVEWEDGECTYEPLDIIGADSPITCAIYAKENNLLDEPGWKRFKRLATREVQFQRTLNQARLRSVRRVNRYKYGFKIPNTHEEAMLFDKENGNTLWADAEKLEIAQLFEYTTFIDKGKGGIPPSGFKLIRCHMIYDVKHDGRHRARMVAGGHLTPAPLESIYSGVVSLRGLRLIVFLAELNGLCLWGGDVGSAYLEALTNEKVYIIAGPEFGPLQGHILVIYKALYGLRSSGLRWHERLADILRDIGFFPSKADGDIWMREKSGIYEYIGVYVDDLAIAAIDPQQIVSELQDKHKLKLKGVGALTFHLGCDFFRDPDGTLAYGPRKYVDKMIETYTQLFKLPPKDYSSPLEKNDHPELDTSDFLEEHEITLYQSMIGACQWAVSLGRFDIQTALMTMSQYRIAPRQGHLERMKRIYGYLKRFRDGAIRVRIGEPDYSGLHIPPVDWSYSVYGNVSELVPDDAPVPLGKHVVLSHFKDANLYHDLTTGRAVTGVLHFINQTPLDWYSKKQATVETATYGAEFVAARIATDQIIDIRTTLRYLGVPINGPSYLFGDNQSVVINATIPHSSLKKRHNALSYHRVREAIAAKIFWFLKIKSAHNPADILSKHCGYQGAWPHVKTLLFWRGDTKDIKSNKTRENGE